MKSLCLSAAALFLAACATRPVNMSDIRRVVGTENDVRLDAEVSADELSLSTAIPIKYEITNSRTAPIAVADIVPESTYDAETQTVTVNIGSEVPGTTLLPRLIPIAPGEKRIFSSVVRVMIAAPVNTVRTLPRPNALRVKLTFLSDIRDFTMLLSIPEKGVYDPALADELFPKWLEHNETVFTNTLPMRWAPNRDLTPDAGASRR